MFNRRPSAKAARIQSPQLSAVSSAYTYEPHYIGATMKVISMLLQSYMQSETSVHNVVLPGSKTAISYNHQTHEFTIFDLHAEANNKYDQFPYIAKEIYGHIMAAFFKTHKNENFFDYHPSVQLHAAGPVLNTRGKFKLLSELENNGATRETIHDSNIQPNTLSAIKVSGDQGMHNFINALEDAAKVYFGVKIVIEKEKFIPVEDRAGASFHTTLDSRK